MSGAGNGGFRLTRAYGDRGPSLAERIRQTWASASYAGQLHRRRVQAGETPKALLAFPKDPLPGDAKAGERLRAGRLTRDDYMQVMASVDLKATEAPESWRNWVNSWVWLRDMAAVGPMRAVDLQRSRELTAHWLAQYPTYDHAAWAPNVTGQRLMMAAFYADYIMPEGDAAARTQTLEAMARWCRHLIRAVPALPAGLSKLEAATGLLGAALVLPEATLKTAKAEAVLATALTEYIPESGVVLTRCPLDQARVGDLMLKLTAFYEARGLPVSRLVEGTLAEIRTSLAAMSLGDGLPPPWHGGAPGPEQLDRLGVDNFDEKPTAASGYVKLQAGEVCIIVDGGPPPSALYTQTAYASTLAFAMTDGSQNLVVNCGGERGMCGMRGYSPELTMGLRSTAGHSALVLADTNSSRIHIEGPRPLGGVEEVIGETSSTDEGHWFEATHDGWRRRFGYAHTRRLWLAPDGNDLRGADLLEPYKELLSTSRGAGDLPVSVRFHLGPDAETILTEDGRGALIQLSDSNMQPTALWAFKATFMHAPGLITLEPSLMIDADGTTHEVQQLLLTTLVNSGKKAEISWSFKRLPLD